MTITYPLTFPTTVGLVDSVLRMRTAVSMNQSPFSFVQQTYNWQGEIWEMDVTMPLMKRGVAEQYKSFLASLKGRLGTFLMYVPSSTAKQSDYLDTSKQITTIAGDHLTTISGDHLITAVASQPYAISGSAGSKTVKLSGMAPSVTNALAQGDYFHFGSGSTTRLHKILNNASTNSNGEATIDIFPTLRRDIVFGEVVEFDNVYGLFRLASNVTEFSSDYNNLFSLSFSAVEAINGT